MIKFLDVDGWHKHHAATGESLHVYVNGVDVTKNCYRAVMHDDGINGDAFVFSTNRDGRKYLNKDKGEVAKEILTGVMRIEPGGPLS